ncbi:MAG: hypothetical protein LBP75_04695 [Planctomycetota bacterium]|jgi:predicted aspartyl protease|nr:hypothetical protein [Planctomycetota bacterium]
MGHVYAEIALSNYRDEIAVEEGRMRENEVRQLTVRSLVDSGSTLLAITPKEQARLCLAKQREEFFGTADNREVACEVVGPVKVRFKNRESICDAVVIPDTDEVLLGAIPMEEMNLVIYPDEGRLDVNPKRRVARIGLR